MCVLAVVLAPFLSFHVEKKSKHGEEKDRQAQEGAFNILTNLDYRSRNGQDGTDRSDSPCLTQSLFCSVKLNWLQSNI